MRTDQGHVVKLKNYKAPAHRARTVAMDFLLEPEDTIVSTSVLYERARDAAADTSTWLLMATVLICFGQHQWKAS
ncbi:MAG: hypothetical protein R3D29_00480 [Nitratireductor sp.]